MTGTTQKDAEDEKEEQEKGRNFPTTQVLRVFRELSSMIKEFR